ncbi:hypothetical protein B9Z55_027630 [Caenorhabditis nigoni]|uniref:Uncharacterized protein n=1 Tax=Caenorhabditis nigoni TaxID=1611254 RepID=A0A2G5SEK5_9PELO|nr:hypothetical protein B9Z55_027630 [Caenorhabditis nigoni]
MGQMLSWPDVSDKPLSSADIVGSVVAMGYVLVIILWLLSVCFYSHHIDHREPKKAVTNHAASRFTGTDPPVKHIIFEIRNVDEKTDSAAQNQVAAPNYVALNMGKD